MRLYVCGMLKFQVQDADTKDRSNGLPTVKGGEGHG